VKALFEKIKWELLFIVMCLVALTIALSMLPSTPPIVLGKELKSPSPHSMLFDENEERNIPCYVADERKIFYFRKHELPESCR